ncbi:hypothetical protein FRC10_010229 [Ceratobasidium sp. 414]|nr:hypothetical protein FRC10_010229 [Ceratobasidium sp. 414]
MNLLKRPFRHPSRSVTPEPAPDSTKHPKLAPGSTPTSSRSINDLDIHTSALSPQPIAATNAPPLRRGSQNPVPQVKTPALVSITCPPATFPAAENKSATHDKWTGLKRFASVLRPSTNAFDFGPLKSVVDGIAESITVYEAAAEAHEEYESLRNQLDWLFHDLAGRFGESTPPAMRPSIMNLARLSPSHAAWYNSAASEDIYRDECTPDTRLEVLERFRLWQDDNESEKIYWLNGMAGTGKTMLAYTLCKQLEGDNKLVANFFCTRQLPSCRDAKLILPTIAYQLANFSYPFRYALSQILDQNRDVHTRRISEQFEKLLCEPLREVRHSLPFNLVVVIDGLDECENDRGVGEILDALFKHVSDMPIKFFLTSRPEPAIRGRMLRRRGDRDRFELHLHELDKGVVREDIKKYLQSGLKHPDFTLSNEHLEILAERSGLHTPYDGLYTGNLEMAKELQRVLYGPQYAKIYGPSEWPSADNKGPLCGGDTWKRCLAERRKEILEFARLLPGLEDVLHPPKSSELVSLVQDGVAVILNIDSSRCDALVIQAGTQEIAHVPLSRFSLREAEDARVKPVPDSDIEGAEGFSEAGSECQEVPVGLWDNVVEPQAPLADGPLHITWCTSGPYSSLPLHAVGHYSGHWAKIKGKERTVQSNRAISPYIPISSYTPTLSSLSQQTSPSSTFSGVLAVGPGSTRVALGAWDELSKVQIQVKHLPFTRLGGEDACTDTVLEAMETHSWVHFACCAAQTSFGPMKPGLRLHDGDLELARIARNPLKNAQLAFLSSRGTIWDCKSPDELICFAVGLLMVGYPTVIATTLPITDPSAPLIAESVYECLLESGVPDSRKAAKALHKAVAILREEVGVGQFARWARYVHIGR